MDGSPEKASPGDATRNHSPAWGVASTRSLLARAQTGDERALEEILARYLPRLMRWAAGRLPTAARDIVDTGDVVQESLIKVVRALGGIREHNPGTFPAYLRKTVLNRLRDEAKRAGRRPELTDLDGSEQDSSPTPLEESIGRDLASRYEAALLRLDDRDRAILFLKIEMDMDYREMADALDKPSADAVRMAVTRAGLRLAREMQHARRA